MYFLEACRHLVLTLNLIIPFFPLDAHQKIAHLLTKGSHALHLLVPGSKV